jgi:hypothetical protein
MMSGSSDVSSFQTRLGGEFNLTALLAVAVGIAVAAQHKEWQFVRGAALALLALVKSRECSVQKIHIAEMVGLLPFVAAVDRLGSGNRRIAIAAVLGLGVLCRVVRGAEDGIDDQEL